MRTVQYMFKRPTFRLLDHPLLDFPDRLLFNYPRKENTIFSLPCVLIFNQFDHCNGCIVGNSLDDNSWSFMHFIHLLLYSDIDCSLVFERSNQQTRSNSFMFFRRYSNVSWCFTQVKS